MIDPIGASAVQALATDVANLSARLAIQMAIVEEVQRCVNELDQSQWTMENIAGEEDQPPQGYRVIVPGPEMDKLARMLSFIQTLQ